MGQLPLPRRSNRLERQRKLARLHWMGGGAAARMVAVSTSARKTSGDVFPSGTRIIQTYPLGRGGRQASTRETSLPSMPCRSAAVDGSAKGR